MDDIEDTSYQLWREAETLADIGELTAQWIEKALPFYPSSVGGPDEETDKIQNYLLYFNRNGFVTTFSQPAENFDGEGSAQRVNVGNFAEEKAENNTCNSQSFWVKLI